MKKLLHTPEGVRDIYGEELRKKYYLEKTINKLMHCFGYNDIETPTFEFFDIFSSKIGTIPSKELYKFFDKEGNTLVLRPDFTPSIARATAKYFMDDINPLRFCYTGNTFVNASDYQGRLKETTQIGAELINDASVDADVEMLLMMIEALKKSGLTDFQVSIGNLEFFKGLCSEYNIDDEKELELRDMINDKNYFGTQDILDSLELSEETKDIFLKMPEMFGSIEKILEAKNFVTNKRSIIAINRLEEIYNLLKINKCEKYVSFDLGMLSKYNYYTGIIFKAYTYGSGDAIITGGRYDNLLSEFGKISPAIGFVIEIDRLLSVLIRQNINVNVNKIKGYLILFNNTSRVKAYEKANVLRNNSRVILINKETTNINNLNRYIEYNDLELIEL